MVNEKQWYRKASGGEGEIFSRLWANEAPKAVLQIAHGMAEHSERYKEFATLLAENGYVVCMEDHAGHGPHTKCKGFFAEKDGWLSVVNDVKGLMDEVTALYPGLPVFLMGHSMGSFLVRSYIVRYGEGLSGCILSGTMGPNPLVNVVKTLIAITVACKGKKAEATLIGKLSGGANQGKFKNEGSPFAWLTTDTAEVQKYEDDPFCGFVFTASGYGDLFDGITEITAPGWADKVPRKLPVYIYSGEDDPVGDYGKGVKQVFDALKACDVEDVEIKLYCGGRHEMHNEVNKQEVYADVLGWLDKKVAAKG
ncbi:hydrolase [Spirochaetia bacterium]|nr:hydrolase [Spirochaetia bacterium]